MSYQPRVNQAWRAGFDKTVAANGVDTNNFTLITAGTGHAVAQTNGSLTIQAGTTARSEAIVRSVETMSGDFNLRYFATLSQRIANNNFFVEAVDVIGDGLSYTISSATVLVVTIPSNPFTSANVGQSMFVGAFSGTGTFLSGRYTIASVSGNNVTFTVSGFAAGTGTCSLFGWNYHHVLYSGTTATSALYDTQRNGWAIGDGTVTINTTASGHAGTLAVSNATAVYLDQIGTTATALELTQRASRVRNIADQETNLYVQLRSANGSTAPATSTTLTIGYVEMTSQASGAVTIANIAPQSQNTALPVTMTNTSMAVSGTVTANLGTGGTAATSLGKAEDAVAASGDTGVFVLGVRNDTLAGGVTSGTGDYSQVSVDTSGILMTAGAPRALKIRQATTITSSTTETTIVSQTAATFNDLYALIIANTSATATEVVIRDTTAGTAVMSIHVPAGDTRGFTLPVDSAIPQAAVNTNWTAQCSTSVASVKIMAMVVRRV